MRQYLVRLFRLSVIELKFPFTPAEGRVRDGRRRWSPRRRVSPSGVCLSWNLCHKYFSVDFSENPRSCINGSQ
ncbi:hypothetical protein R6Z07F_015663 [Ovis aries]